MARPIVLIPHLYRLADAINFKKGLFTPPLVTISTLSRGRPSCPDIAPLGLRTSQPNKPYVCPLSPRVAPTVRPLPVLLLLAPCYLLLLHRPPRCSCRFSCSTTRSARRHRQVPPAQGEASGPGAEALRPRLLLQLRRPDADGGGGRTGI